MKVCNKGAISATLRQDNTATYEVVEVVTDCLQRCVRFGGPEIWKFISPVREEVVHQLSQWWAFSEILKRR